MGTPMNLPLLALLTVLATAAAAADPAPDDQVRARAEARALLAEALRAGDVWTVLQLEAWGAAHELRLRSALPGVTVVGDPLFAAPVDLDVAADLGDRVVAVGGRHVYQWRPDGRPLACARPLPMDPRQVALGYGATHLAAVTIRQTEAAPAVIILATAPVAEGDGGLRLEIPGEASEHLRGLVVADDGSAAALASVSVNALGVASPPRILLAQRGGQRALVGWHRPLAVGREGAWLAAYRGGEDTPAVHTAKGDTPFTSFAAGPGIAMLVHAGTCQLVGRDGTLAPYEPPIGMGANAEVVTLGEWLVFSSGHGATTRPSLDLLGNTVGGGQPQPPTCAWVRWQDLVDDPAAPAAGREVMPLRIARSHQAALLRWHDRQLDLIDLSGTTPAVRPFATTAAPVQDLQWYDQRAVVRLTDGSWQVLALDGTEVWSGKAARLDLENRRYAVIADGVGDQQERSVVLLDPDPAKRTRVPLKLEPGPWAISIAFDGGLGVAFRHEGAWHAFSVSTGEISASGDVPETRPRVHGVGTELPGRFALARGRLIAKTAAAAPAAPPTAAWAPLDAWRVGRTTTVIGRGGRIYVTGKRGEYLDLGTVPGAARFVGVGGRLLVADDDGLVLAGFVAGPALDHEPEGKGKPAEELPPGPWQIQGLTYLPPRSSRLRWNTDTGLTPRRLRSPDGDGLLVVLAPVVLEVEPAEARRLGRMLGR